jgi:hypothetical protein
MPSGLPAIRVLPCTRNQRRSSCCSQSVAVQRRRCLLGLNLEAETLDEFREKLPGAIQDLTGRQVAFLIELSNAGQHETYREEDFFEQWTAKSILP